MRKCAFLIILAVLGLANRPAAASDVAGRPTQCARCGRCVCCAQRTCQVVCEIKKETKTSYSVKCEEICPLMPGHCCDRCDGCPPTPRCGHPRYVRKLVKNQYEVNVPVYRCVVMWLCPECANGESASVPTSTPTAPAAPEPPPMPPEPPAPASRMSK